ncbi:30S ribosomal protein S17 [Patescibacteria group bacterium]|nr:30S ribosomal protein S17 [Patescibacteria group bacterium]
MADQKKLQTIRGTVDKICSQNTIRVATKITKVHPLYRKRYGQVKHYIAHDPEGKTPVGSLVTIVACRPISKNKHWVVATATSTD